MTRKTRKAHSTSKQKQVFKRPVSLRLDPELDRQIRSYAGRKEQTFTLVLTKAIRLGWEALQQKEAVA